MLAIFAAGLVLFLSSLALVVARLPRAAPGARRPPLVGVAAFAWIRSGFFPGSVRDPRRRAASTADLSTGPAGLLVPLAGGALLAWLGTRQPRVVTTLLAVLLGGSLVHSLGAAASAWNAKRLPPSSSAVPSVLEWSRNGNVLILILDSLQSDIFEEVLEARAPPARAARRLPLLSPTPRAAAPRPT